MNAKLLSAFGNDKMVANVARVSYDKWDDSEIVTDGDVKLIKYLAKHGHTSPFRHPHLQFRIKCPIYVARQLAKHQVGVAVNEISGRYVDFSDEYTLIPDGKWRKQSKSSKQGSDGLVDDYAQKVAARAQKDVLDAAMIAYEALTNLGVSKEQARSILPLSLNTTMIVTYSLQAFIHLCELRLKPDAQYETRQLVLHMLDEVLNAQKFTVSLEAFEII